MNKNQLMCVVLCLLILISFAQVHSFGDDESDAKSSGSEKSSEESTGSEPNSVIVKSSKGVDKGRESREESQQLVSSNSPKAVERKLEISKRQNVLETASPNDTEKNLVPELGSTTIEDMNVTKSRSNFTPKSGRSSQKSTNKPGLLEGAASTGSQEDMTASSGTGEGSTPEPSEEAVQSRDRSLRNSGNRAEDPNRSPLEQKKADGAVPDSFHTPKTIEPPASDSNEGVLALSSIQRLMSGATNLIGRLPLVNRFVSKESPAVREDADNTRALRNKELQEQKDLAEKLQSLEAVHSQLRQEKEDISVQFQNVSRKNLHLEEAKQIHESSSSRVLLTVTHEFYEKLKILNPLELGNKISELFSEVNIPPGLRENIGPKTFAVSHFRDNDVIVLEAVHEKAAAVIVAALQAPNIMPIFQDLLNAVYSSGTLLSELQDRKLFGVSGFRALPGSYPRKLKKGVSRDFFALATLFPLLCGTAVGFACAWVWRRHYIRAEILKHERNNCY